MADAKSAFLENELLDHVLRNSAYTPAATIYLALFTSSPGETGSGTEVTGGSYARQAITFGAASGGSCVSSNAQTYTSMPTATVTDFGIYDASTSGNLLYYGAFLSSVSVSSGDTLSVASGNITISEA